MLAIARYIGLNFIAFMEENCCNSNSGQLKLSFIRSLIAATALSMYSFAIIFSSWPDGYTRC